MAQSVPQQVLERAQRNLPISQQPPPKFRSYDWLMRKVVDNPAGTGPSPTPVAVFNISWNMNSTPITAYAPPVNENDRPRINIWRSDGSYVTYLSAGSTYWNVDTSSFSSCPWGNRDIGSITLSIPISTNQFCGVDFFTASYLPTPSLSPNLNLWSITSTENPGETKYQYLINDGGVYDVSIVIN